VRSVSSQKLHGNHTSHSPKPKHGIIQGSALTSLLCSICLYLILHDAVRICSFLIAVIVAVQLMTALIILKKLTAAAPRFAPKTTPRPRQRSAGSLRLASSGPRRCPLAGPSAGARPANLCPPHCPRPSFNNGEWRLTIMKAKKCQLSYDYAKPQLVSRVTCFDTCLAFMRSSSSFALSMLVTAPMNRKVGQGEIGCLADGHSAPVMYVA